MVSAMTLGSAVVSLGGFASASYSLVHSYDYTNWYTDMLFQNLPDPTQGTVDYVSLADAQSLGLTKIINKKVYMGVDNTTIVGGTGGRKSIWTESKYEFTEGLLIGDFEHVPGSDCGTWPAFWTIRNGQGTYAEIDILEGFNDITQNYITMHTGGPQNSCTFQSPSNLQSGTPNNANYDCSLDSASGVGCSVVGPEGSYGDGFNAGGGGVYAMDWTSTYIRIYYFPRASIPADITSGKPDPSKWGIPTANFDTAYGNCDIPAEFPAQTIYFDTTFCGASAGGLAWTEWTDCSSKTGVSTCEEYVRGNPGAFDEAYWLINSVKLYQSA